MQPDSFPVDPGIGVPDDYQTVVPSDTVDLNFRTRSIWVGVTGDIACHARDRTTVVVFKNVPGGAHFIVRTTRVLATGTTATFMIAEK
jgi:hypothetical protein